MTEQLKFEVGKCYRTRNGRKVTIWLVRPGYVIGELEGSHGPTAWTLGGGYFTKPIEHELDLVAEWREPARVTARLYRNTASGAVKVFAHHRPSSDWELIGKGEIVEGEGLT